MAETFSYRELVSFLEKEGFVYARSKGSHDIYKHPDGRMQSIAGKKSGRELNLNYLKNFLKEIGVSLDYYKLKTSKGNNKKAVIKRINKGIKDKQLVTDTIS